MHTDERAAVSHGCELRPCVPRLALLHNERCPLCLEAQLELALVGYDLLEELREREHVGTARQPDFQSSAQPVEVARRAILGQLSTTTCVRKGDCHLDRVAGVLEPVTALGERVHSRSSSRGDRGRHGRGASGARRG
eukprot:scaffold131341_cov31-Tisochrysis_lutea.AAC.8